MEKSEKNNFGRNYENITLSGVKGFVVHIYDLINFDIDLIIPDEHQNFFKNALMKNYVYFEYNDRELLNHSHIEQQLGKAYRCHLRGVSINKALLRKFSSASSLLKIEIERLLNHTNANVICNISGIDGYSRVLVEIFIETSKGLIDLKNFLLEAQRNLDIKLFRVFSL